MIIMQQTFPLKKGIPRRYSFFLGFPGKIGKSSGFQSIHAEAFIARSFTTAGENYYL